MNGKIESKDSFPPQVGAVYDLNNGVELFGGYTENMAAYVSAATSGPFASQNQAVVDFVRDNLKPETSKTFEGGLRLQERPAPGRGRALQRRLREPSWTAPARPRRSWACRRFCRTSARSRPRASNWPAGTG